MLEHTAQRFASVRKLLPKLVFLLCVIQPVLDVAGYWQTELQISNTITMLIRMLLLAGTFLLGFTISDRKRWYIIAASVLVLLTVGHIAACMNRPNGYQKAVTDLVNLVRIYFLPLMTICFITFLKQNEEVFPAMLKGMAIDIVLIAAVQLISTLTCTDPHTYHEDGIGVRGWFMWTNSQSAILAMLTPIVIAWFVQRWKGRILPAILIAAICEATLYFLAPRLAYASMLLSGAGIALALIITDRKRWKQALAVFLVTCLFAAAYPLSPTSKRLNKNQARTEKTVEHIIEADIVIPEETVLPTDEDGQVEQNAKPVIVLDDQTADNLEALYRSQDIIWSMVDRFGRDKVFQIYQYTLDPTVLQNTRQMKINFCTLLMQEAGTLSHLFGLNLAEMTYQRYDANSQLVTDNYDVENDFHGVYFLTGIVGLGLIALFLLYFGLRTLLAVFRKPKQYFTLPVAAFGIAYGLGLIHAYYTASVLRRNNASIYLAMVLAGLWYLSRRSGTDKNEMSTEKK